MSEHPVTLTINGHRHRATVEGRLLLSDFLRVEAGYTGVHVGCEHGVCGACTVIVDGKAVLCRMLAVQAMAPTSPRRGPGGTRRTLHPVKQALRTNRLQAVLQRDS